MKIQRQPLGHTMPRMNPMPYHDMSDSGGFFVSKKKRKQSGNTHVGQNTTKGSGEGRGAEEQGHTILPLAAFIPHREVVHNTREQTYRMSDIITGHVERRHR